MFSDQDTPQGKIQAHDLLLLAVERYFAQATVSDGSSVHKTLLPPIYLQRPGHSLTIVGFERRSDSYCNLVVLDPVYATSPAMHKLIGRKNIKSGRPEVMHAYRRGPAHLRKFAAFEILMSVSSHLLYCSHLTKADSQLHHHYSPLGMYEDSHPFRSASRLTHRYPDAIYPHISEHICITRCSCAIIR